MSELSPSSRLEAIPPDECMRLLATEEFGRLAVIDNDRPMIFPVNYAAEGQHVVIRTGEGTKLDASRLRRVAFEVDRIDSRGHTGWSVVIQGVGHEITDALDSLSERVRSLPLDPWPAGEKSHWVRIVPEHITGRRLLPPPSS